MKRYRLKIVKGEKAEFWETRDTCEDAAIERAEALFCLSERGYEIVEIKEMP